jgi:hypothetical protein
MRRRFAIISLGLYVGTEVLHPAIRDVRTERRSQKAKRDADSTFVGDISAKYNYRAHHW